MALSFLTHSQEMTFVDRATLSITPAHALLPFHTYDVFVVIQNDDTSEHTPVFVDVTHSAFGIGLPGGATFITPPSPVSVPPKLGNTNGQATVEFQFTTPAGGHTCLSATIRNTGKTISQNVDVFGVPAGTASTLSFLVYGNATQPESMRLDVTERSDTGPITAANSWNPRIVAPAGVGPTSPTPAPVTLNLGANAFDTINLRVTVPPGAVGTHIFHVVGTVNGTDVGEVDIRVEASPFAVAAPRPWITGGYHTPDIILIDPLTSLPVYNAPGTDAELRPGTNYGFQACVHNDSATEARNTVVRFWHFPGGVGSAGALLDIQTAAIPPMGTVIVTSNVPFPSAPAGEHRCAVVSLYNAMSTNCTIDASTAALVPSWVAGESCSAWRNTDSMRIYVGVPWYIYLEASLDEHIHIPNPGPVEIDVETLAVPRNFAELPELRTVRDSLIAAGIPAQKMHKLDSLQPLLHHTDLGVAIASGRAQGGDVKREQAARGGTAVAAPTSTKLTYTKGRAPFTITGSVPASAQPGDIFMVRVKATYPEQKGTPSRVISFLQELTVAKRS